MANKCYQHLPKEDGLQIKDSKLGPRAGKGLFATKDFAEGRKVCNYDGEVVRSHDPDYGGPYALEVAQHKFIDASKTNSGPGRFANACRRSKGDECSGNNAQLRPSPAYGGMLKAMKKIKAGREVFVAYGRQYWQHWK